MVVFVDFEADDDEMSRAALPSPEVVIARRHIQKLKAKSDQTARSASQDDEQDQEERILLTDASNNDDGTISKAEEETGLNINSFSTLLACYPAVRSLAHHLDLNDLHALACTCRQFHHNLIQFCHQLLGQSLRCSNDMKPLLGDILAVNGRSSDNLSGDDDHSPVLASFVDVDAIAELEKRALSRKVSRCARDLVAECRRCGTVVCRNCAIKPPSNTLLRGRHRRLCTMCQDAPLWVHTQPRKIASIRSQPPAQDGWGKDRTDSWCDGNISHSLPSANTPLHSGPTIDWKDDARHDETTLLDTFTAHAFAHDPCSCASRGVFLCQACGNSLRSDDITYQRVWTWRSRYSTHIGGLGTGMGAGEQGQKCGRGKYCLDATESEVEIDCSERGDHAMTSSPSVFPTSTTSNSSSSSPNPQPTESDSPPLGASTPISASTSEHDLSLSAGYLRQEVEGIGGVVKKKVKKRVRVGATVCEFDDERSSGKYLAREASGRERSWCGWCDRVILPTV